MRELLLNDARVAIIYRGSIPVIYTIILPRGGVIFNAKWAAKERHSTNSAYYKPREYIVRTLTVNTTADDIAHTATRTGGGKYQTRVKG